MEDKITYEDVKEYHYLFTMAPFICSWDDGSQKLKFGFEIQIHNTVLYG